MESAVRSPWIKSAITTGRARNDALLASQDSQYSRVAELVGRVTGDRKSGTIPAKIPGAKSLARWIVIVCSTLMLIYYGIDETKGDLAKPSGATRTV